MNVFKIRVFYSMHYINLLNIQVFVYNVIDYKLEKVERNDASNVHNGSLASYHHQVNPHGLPLINQEHSIELLPTLPV